MTYGPQHGRRHRVQVFSSPGNTYIGVQEVERPCGVDGGEVDGADAVATLNAVRFQIAAFRPALLDSDGDGKAELLIGAWGHDPGERSMAGATYFLATSDFSAADAADGRVDGRIFLSNIGRGMNLPAIGRPK